MENTIIIIIIMVQLIKVLRLAERHALSRRIPHIKKKKKDEQSNFNTKQK